MAVPGVFFLFIGGFVVIATLMIVLSIIAAKKRREAFSAFAASRGWTYAERDDRWGEQFDGHPFDQGHNRQSSSVLTGTHDGRPCVVFDFTYHTTETSTDAQGHTSSHEESHDFAITAIDCGVVFPRLTVTPEGFLRRFVGKLFNKDIELESEDFNRAFTVTCEDRKFASDVLHPRMMELLLTRREMGWGFNGRWILSYDGGSTDLAEIDPKLAALDSVLDNIPEFVWREVKGPSA
jgi:hypothetical protein